MLSAKDFEHERARMKIDPTELISQAEAARIRGVSHQTISYLIKQGRVRTFDVGGRLFVLRSEIENYESRPAGRPRKKPAKQKSTKRAKSAIHD